MPRSTRKRTISQPTVGAQLPNDTMTGTVGTDLGVPRRRTRQRRSFAHGTASERALNVGRALNHEQIMLALGVIGPAVHPKAGAVNTYWRFFGNR
jgi:hypothetical protein